MTTGTAKEKSAEFELTWSFEKAESKPSPLGGEMMRLAYEVTAFEEVYLSDRLWDYGESGRRVPDPFGVYRFVREQSLRLVFAQAPRPLPLTPRVIYEPLFSRVRPGETHRSEWLLALPVEEYSALSRDTSAASVVEEIEKVFLVMAYRLRSDMETDPAPPPGESAEEAGYIVYDPKLLVSSLQTKAPFQVKRRTVPMPRFDLPGEPPLPRAAFG